MTPIPTIAAYHDALVARVCDPPMHVTDPGAFVRDLGRVIAMARAWERVEERQMKEREDV